MGATVVAWIVLTITAVEPGTNAIPQDDAVQILLNRPAADPPWGGAVRPASGDAPPGDDAPIERLLSYWICRPQMDELQSLHKIEKTIPPPTAKTLTRLLERCVKSPQHLPGLLQYFPDTPESVERIKQWYDRIPAAAGDETWRLPVRTWLMRRSGYFRDELIQNIKKGKPEYWQYQKGREWEDLAR